MDLEVKIQKFMIGPRISESFFDAYFLNDSENQVIILVSLFHEIHKCFLHVLLNVIEFNAIKLFNVKVLGCTHMKSIIPNKGQEDSLEKEMETHSNILAWEIP